LNAHHDYIRDWAGVNDPKEGKHGEGRILDAVG
jgi:hypothetical protein